MPVGRSRTRVTREWDPVLEGLDFRLAAVSDLPWLLALLIDDDVARSRGDYTTEITPNVRLAFDDIAADPNNEVWVAVLDGRVVGMAQLTVIPGLSRGGKRRAQVEAVRVDSTLRGRGIGEELMAVVTRRARDAGCSFMQLTSDERRTNAHRFYERLGFDGSHVGMKKTLEA